MRFVFPSNLLGWPALSLPVGRSQGGLPIGFQLMGRPWEEETVLRAAEAVERRVGVLGTPRSIPPPSAL
jgi:aspartyl-tRNA(Asn)/glutamyl-tRNA(Gln) amidotransferase subunit A